MQKLVMIVGLILAATSVASAQTKQRYIGMTKAKQIASTQVAGKIKSAEREKEQGKMIYSFDIRGNDGKIHEVTLDAFTGDVLTNDIETPADEAKEKAADRKAKKH